MKKNLIGFTGIMLVLTAGLFFTSCSKDSDPAADLVGTWTFSNATFDAKIGTKTLIQYFMDEMGLTEAQAQQVMVLFNAQMQQAFTGTIEMKSDNTYTATIGGESDSGTWSLSSDNTKLTIDSDTEDPVVFDILELTSHKLVLKGTESVEEDLNDDTVPETITVTLEMTLTK
ncbi:MAG: hypothetical protein GX431_02435 [Bacteroidales bacterium]|jgi:hypothetical protein|nr:hypothetical protein [Bacteroidales bacterium]